MLCFSPACLYCVTLCLLFLSLALNDSTVWESLDLILQNGSSQPLELFLLGKVFLVRFCGGCVGVCAA